MKKPERLQDLMIYLNGKNSFNLKDVMNKYQISKSTALRDIQSLESIGMPIYSQQGRNGYYGILPNRLLSPIVFTVDEMYALYFAMLTLSDYQTTPFHLSTTVLKNKFELCLSDEKKNQLRKMERILQMGGTKHFNESKFLKDILAFATDNKVCEVEYTKNSATQTFYVQFFNISSSFGQWYTTAFNFQSEKPIVFRCDKISSIMESKHYIAKNLLEFDTSSFEFFKSADAIDFRVEITQKGVDKFYKENYPSMKLEMIGSRFYINGYYNEGEESFIANYLVSYGKQILSISPEELKSSIKNTIRELDSYYLSVI
ncbi:YafY family protein [Sinanaerobacter sp. ZZT-01]|uniref:helix-turn-helix transcriptional regulator n=1 Tax=Sinanaerobacter sp. ZZT-01 TaxID=3111540 RepID=UPI002D76C1AB|nr:YafY family protein [Sinanaerobacter sp. ZZT-01]WRR93784.1 YafY family protein [Sinanaerobacter sp. ZZT-01]